MLVYLKQKVLIISLVIILPRNCHRALTRGCIVRLKPVKDTDCLQSCNAGEHRGVVVNIVVNIARID